MAHDFSKMSTAEILDLYNEKASFLDRPVVKKFESREAAERRTQKMLDSVASIAAASSPSVTLPVPAAAPMASADEGATQVAAEAPAIEEVASAPTDIVNEELTASDTIVTDTVTNEGVEEVATGKKAKAKAPAKPKTAKVAKADRPKNEKPPRGPDEFARPGSYRTLMINCMLKTPGEQVSRTKLIKAMYGDYSPEFHGPFGMVLTGVKGVVADRYELRKTKADKEIYFGLYPRK